MLQKPDYFPSIAPDQKQEAEDTQTVVAHNAEVITTSDNLQSETADLTTSDNLQITSRWRETANFQQTSNKLPEGALPYVW